MKEEAGPIISLMHYLDLTLAGIAANLALDEALLIEAEELGSSCRWRDDVRVDECLADGVALARRTSGGGTVVVGPGTLNVTVVLPNDAAAGVGARGRPPRFLPPPPAGGPP